ncbi:hypothetical protein ABMY12_20795 [Vibrio vulnificus]|uniref:hypothetical protein n=1 Tax=Vibrio vulnificus TaxID=672 RepID=UPI0040580789
MKLVMNITELKQLDKKTLNQAVLGGNLTSCSVGDSAAIEESTSLILQTPLNLHRSVAQAKIVVDAVEYLKDRKIKAVVIAEYVYLRAFSSYIRSKQRYHAYFISGCNALGECHITRFSANNGKLEQYQERARVSGDPAFLKEEVLRAIEMDLQGDWKNAKVLIFSNEHDCLDDLQDSVNFEMEIVKTDLLAAKRWGASQFATKELLLTKNFQASSSRKPVAMGVAISLLITAIWLGSYGWLSWKQNQFESLQEKYLQVSDRQKLEFESADLVLWSKRDEYLKNINQQTAISYKIEKILMALSSMSSDTKIVVQQISIGKERDFRANGKYYNTKLEIGFERKSNNAEYDVSQALNAFMESLGDVGDGVDVWDRIRPQTFNGDKFNMVTLYTNTMEN